MSNDMEESTQLTDLSDHRQHHHRYRYHHHHQGRTPVGEIGDDECSTDSCCSSGGSTGSGECLSRQNNVDCERLCRSSRSRRTHCYPERLRGRLTRSQERLSTSVQRSSERTWSPPEDVRNLSRDGISSSSCSSSPSHAHSSSDFLKRPSIAETLRRTFQSLMITSSKWDNNKEKKYAEKSPKRILRSPVPYIYLRGPSGLPTQRIPRNSAFQQQTIQSYSCQEIGLYR